MKTCSKCGVRQPNSEFPYREGTRRGGYCRGCTGPRHPAGWYEALPPEAMRWLHACVGAIEPARCNSCVCGGLSLWLANARKDATSNALFRVWGGYELGEHHS